MKDLLPHLESLLQRLRNDAPLFADRYPRLAGALSLAAHDGAHPGIARLIEAHAMLHARIGKKLADEQTLLAAAFLDIQAPHLMRPFPACSIASITLDNGIGDAGAVTTIPRGTVFKSADIDGVACRFRTAFDVTLAPVAVTGLRFQDNGTVSPAIAITLEWPHGYHPVQAGLTRLRLLADGETSLCTALLDTLLLRTSSAWIDAGNGERRQLDAVPLAAAGFAENESLLPGDALAHHGERLLTEYFCFPDKFMFIDLDMAAICVALPQPCRRCTIHLPIDGIETSPELGRQLRALSARNLVAGCTPIVNLFRHAASPMRLDHTVPHHTVLADTAHAAAYHVHAIRKASLVQAAGQADIREFRPFFLLRQGEQPGASERYWIMRRNATVAATHPGYEVEVAFLDGEFNPLAAHDATVSLELLCSNGDLPSRLPHGTLLEYVSEAVLPACRMRMLRQPSRMHRGRSGQAALLRLATQFANGCQPLANTSLASLRDRINACDMACSASSQQHIGGVTAYMCQPDRLMIRHQDNMAPIYGVHIRLTLDESAFSGSGMHAFMRVLDDFFAFSAHINSYTRLSIDSHATHQELLRCPARNGNRVLT